MKRWNEAPSHIKLPLHALLSGVRATFCHIKECCANPLLWSTCFHQSIMFSSTKLLPAQGGPPSLGSGFCQRSVFCSYFRGKALHLVLGREGIFPLNCFSLSRAPCLRYTLWKSSTSKICFCTRHLLCFICSSFLFF